MAHIDERTLEQLLNHKMSRLDIDVVLAHAAECRGCGHRLEEWRDHFEEIATLLPVPQASPQPMALPAAFVLVPDNPSPRRRFDLTNLLWIAAVGMALVVGYAASRLQDHSSDGLATSPMAGIDPMADSPQNLAMAKDSVPTVPVDTAAQVADSAEVDPPAVRPVRTPPQDPAPAPAHTAATKSPAPAASLGASPPPDALNHARPPASGAGRSIKRLDGGIRFLSNMNPITSKSDPVLRYLAHRFNSKSSASYTTRQMDHGSCSISSANPDR
jgi:hypothetical protein